MPMTATQRKHRPALRIVRAPHGRLNREKLFRQVLHLQSISAQLAAEIGDATPYSKNHGKVRHIDAKLVRLIQRAQHMRNLLP